MKQGFNEREALRLRWLSKNMTQHDQYMNDFMKVFKPLNRWGPGSDSETLRALSNLPTNPNSVLEIGCGKGLATLVLAKNLTANITAVDNESSAIDSLNKILADECLDDHVTTMCASMTQLPFGLKSFDLIWSEASAYIMGVENALLKWRPLLKDDGILVFSDLVLSTSEPSKEVKTFWDKEYPDIQTAEVRRKQIKAAGYEVLSDFIFSKSSWDNYYLPLKARVESLMPVMESSLALKDIADEVDFYLKHFSEFGYQMFVLKKIN
jgi:SAM-dependent methyltransferase